jgi:lysozyme family protein
VKQQIIDQVIAREGGFSDSSTDSGGKTRYGITEKVARRFGYEGQMHELPRALAVEIYQSLYWPASYDKILGFSPSLAAEIFDTSVNLGLEKAGKYLQRALNVMNRNEADYSDLVVDGIIGSATISALSSFLGVRRARGERALLTAVNILQGAHYISLAEKRKKDEANLFGWLLHRITL